MTTYNEATTFTTTPPMSVRTVSVASFSPKNEEGPDPANSPVEKKLIRAFVAEGKGFEPLVTLSATTAFEACQSESLLRPFEAFSLLTGPFTSFGC